MADFEVTMKKHQYKVEDVKKQPETKVIDISSEIR